MGEKASKETQNTQAQLTGTIKYWQHNGITIPKTGIQFPAQSLQIMLPSHPKNKAFTKVTECCSPLHRQTAHHNSVKHKNGNKSM